MDATSWHIASASLAWARAIESKSSWGLSKPSKAYPLTFVAAVIGFFG